MKNSVRNVLIFGLCCIILGLTVKNKDAFIISITVLYWLSVIAEHLDEIKHRMK